MWTKTLSRCASHISAKWKPYWAWAHVKWTKRGKGPSRLLPVQIHKTASIMYGAVLGPNNVGNLHICDGTIYTKRYINVWEQHMLPSRWYPFQGSTNSYQQGKTKPQTLLLTTVWLFSPVMSPMCPHMGKNIRETSECWATRRGTNFTINAPPPKHLKGWNIYNKVYQVGH